MKEVFNILNDWVEKLYPTLDIASILPVQKKAPKQPDTEPQTEENEKPREKTLD